ncbi:MAG: DinB family protein [Acidobacteriota bacterium]|nr:DinB family protein [Acidobacteriota bacterium]
MTKIFLAVALLATTLVAPVFGQQEDVKAAVLKHLKTSREFTLKVAEAMPASDYDFKLTSPQMSFGEQMAHLASGFTYFLSSFEGQKPNPAKPASNSKEDVIAFVKAQYDKAIDQVSKLTPERISKTYKSEEGTMSGVDLLLGMLDHTTHHRASAEMYLRAKGITPPEYQS